MDNFFEALEQFSVKERRSFLGVCRPLIDFLPVKHFFYQCVNKNGRYNFFGTHVDIMSYYFDNDMHLANPFITQFNQTKSGLYLIDSIGNRKYQETRQAVENAYKVKHCLSLTENDGHMCHQYGFYISSYRDEAASVLINHMSLLKSFVEYFKAEMGKVILEMHAHPVDLKKELGDAFGKTVPEMPDILFEQSKLIQFLEQIATNGALVPRTKLTKREIECIMQLLSGKNIPEIAKALYLSKRTIEHRLENIRAKFDCKTKSELLQRLHKMRAVFAI